MRKGFGTLVARAITKELGQMGLDVCACVNTLNVASQIMFRRMGFEIIEKVYWIGTHPMVISTE